MWLQSLWNIQTWLPLHLSLNSGSLLTLLFLPPSMWIPFTEISPLCDILWFRLIRVSRTQVAPALTVSTEPFSPPQIWWPVLLLSSAFPLFLVGLNHDCHVLWLTGRDEVLHWVPSLWRWLQCYHLRCVSASWVLGNTELTVTTYGPGCVLGVSGFPFLRPVKLSCSVQPGVWGVHEYS